VLTLKKQKDMPEKITLSYINITASYRRSRKKLPAQKSFVVRLSYKAIMLNSRTPDAPHPASRKR